MSQVFFCEAVIPLDTGSKGTRTNSTRDGFSASEKPARLRWSDQGSKSFVTAFNVFWDGNRKTWQVPDLSVLRTMIMPFPLL
jgi:hypothetical protein